MNSTVKGDVGVILDLSRNRLRAELFRTTEFKLVSTPLALQAADPYLRPKHNSVSVDGNLTDGLLALWRVLAPAESLRSIKHVLLGSTVDPASYLSELYETLLSLETLGLESQTGLTTYIHTRSSLILLTAPALRRIVNRVKLTLHLETLDPQFAKKLSPSAARPLERLEAASALVRAGFDVTLNVTPLIRAEENRQQVLQQLAKSCLATGATISVSSPERLLGSVTQSSITHSQTNICGDLLALITRLGGNQILNGEMAA